MAFFKYFWPCLFTTKLCRAKLFKQGHSRGLGSVPGGWRKMARSCDGGGVTYFSGLFSARVTDGDAPDTQDLVGFGENWKKENKK